MTKLRSPKDRQGKIKSSSYPRCPTPHLTPDANVTCSFLCIGRYNFNPILQIRKLRFREVAWLPEIPQLMELTELTLDLFPHTTRLTGHHPVLFSVSSGCILDWRPSKREGLPMEAARSTQHWVPGNSSRRPGLVPRLSCCMALGKSPDFLTRPSHPLGYVGTETS